MEENLENAVFENIKIISSSTPWHSDAFLCSWKDLIHGHSRERVGSRLNILEDWVRTQGPKALLPGQPAETLQAWSPWVGRGWVVLTALHFFLQRRILRLRSSHHPTPYILQDFMSSCNCPRGGRKQSQYLIWVVSSFFFPGTLQDALFLCSLFGIS